MNQEIQQLSEILHRLVDSGQIDSAVVFITLRNPNTQPHTQFGHLEFGNGYANRGRVIEWLEQLRAMDQAQAQLSLMQQVAANQPKVQPVGVVPRNGR
jgi:hypothetical protein